jgi:glycosyltransferase involved in cell wall biosynthesis
VELIRLQRASGHEASVLAPAYRGGPETEPTDIPVHRFRYAPARFETLTHDQAVPDRLREHPASAALVPAYLAAGWAAAADLGRVAPDVVHVHWPMPHALFGAGMRWGAGGRTAMVCSYYSVEINWVARRLPVLRPVLSWSVRTADAVTAISSSTALAVRAVCDRPVAVIPYGAAVTKAPDPFVSPALADDGAPLRILFVGRLVQRKGVEVLVRALARMRHERDAELVIVGAGSRESDIRRTAALEGVERWVHMLGFVDETRLAEEYGSCDLFVLPAVVDDRGDTEGLGVVLLEALRHERPVVASAVGGIVDIVEDGVTGWTVQPGDAEVLARKLLEVSSQPSEARRVARQGREAAATTFSWERILHATTDVYGTAREARRAARV